ncbi:MAG: xylose isomerase [Candidatus Nephthysia bennettiae]|uniref:Sugar phosphate isomerase/epimerase n=1 Tax=Candidatus Nephthysia bennettiae TaxID=3127016 RepID=A0A934JZ60_9BACT|nr:sugar phosphate isomerase/epimerase [Candidatus Dormibacteraeota bacterium]PZR95280.1 MAG: xylose isomerase [Candidatus Dormibacteraeota bacterium]
MWTLTGFADEISPDLETQCSTLDDLGIGHIEVRSAWYVNVLDLDDDQLARVRETLDAHRLRTSSVGSPIGKIGIEEDFEPHLARFERALRVAEALEAPYIRLFSFFMPAPGDPARHRDEVLRRMTALTQAARRHGAVLLHENEKEIYGDLPGRCLDLLESVGSERLRLAWDPANFVQCGVRPFTEAYPMLRPHLEYVHVKDALLSTGEVVPAGQGDGELPETLRALEADGFDGFFSMEPHLASSARSGGFSGPQLFSLATRAFTGLLDAQGIDHR